ALVMTNSFQEGINYPKYGGFDFNRLRSGPFEGPAIVIPPALPEDTYSFPMESILFRQFCRMLDYRKETIPPPAQKITLENLHLSSRNLRRRSKPPPFDWLSMGPIVIKYQ
ncbi:MAG: hypothetical protein ABIH03_04550, partial [Pseudomonadota bacterium]